MSIAPPEPALSNPPSTHVYPPFDLGTPGPIRGEMLGIDRLESLARSLSDLAELMPPKRRGSPLLARFEDHGRVLMAAHGRIIERGQRHEGLGLDAEWLLDNFHIVEEVLREVRHDLPPGYDSELPKLLGLNLSGYPRIFAVALNLAAHTDGELDETRITRFVDAFQEGTPLTIGELWALPTMLRLVLLENLRRLAESMIWGWDERDRAERFAHDVLEAGSVPEPGDPTDPFVASAIPAMRDGGTTAALALARLEAELAARGIEPDEALRREHRRQAANQVSVGNAVISLRLVSALDWNTFFERSSRVEAILRDDPSGVYPRQDFPTRDRQRRAVEDTARRSSADERDVAARAIELARGGDAAQGTIGYYLVGAGRSLLRREFGYRTRWNERLLGAALDHPRTVYFGLIVTIWLALVISGAAIGLGSQFGSAWLILAILALALPLSELAVGTVNHLLTLFLPPRVLPKLEFKDGVPDDCPTMVVMPAMLVRPQSAAVLLERLEIHHLANPDKNLRFALLTDFADAEEEHRPEDDEYVREALERVSALNARHGHGKFFLFHRRRQWNDSQGVWMGWERKRGKLSEFNRILRGATDTSYSTLSDDPAQLQNTRFVITLDADTQMPRDTARRMVGTIAHPLNSPRFDPAAGRVVEGYGVLQPRVSFHLTAATHSRFAGLLASSGGIDPYSTAASDAYMDLFGIGSFTGKGIYDVDAFEAATGHTFPENAILSHDLIEGNYARCGLLSDTELFDDFPARYHAYARREHRWARGDWQLLPWLSSCPPRSSTTPTKNPLPTLERWKLFDNLRRSLVPPALIVLFILGWTVLPGSALAWTLIALAVPALPLIQLLFGSVFNAIRGQSITPFLGWRYTVPSTLAQIGMSIAFLAYQARNLLDAIVRTLARLFISHKNMLEWETAATTDRRLGSGLTSFAMMMWPSTVIAGLSAALIWVFRRDAIPAAAPVLASWAIAPVIAWFLSRPKRAGETALTLFEQTELRIVARKTWHFFETFVGPEDRWLPPDNYQEYPDGRIAHRTSPTNQGLLLLSTLSAYDLGYIAIPDLIERLERTLDTFDVMERHWGHFYNWYDTRSLKPLPPAYISTVDSGNLLGCLITLRRGLLEIVEQTSLLDTNLTGLADTLAVAREAFASMPAPSSQDPLTIHRELGKEFVRLGDRLRERPADAGGLGSMLQELNHEGSALLGRVRALAASGEVVPDGVEPWIRRFQAEVARRDSLHQANDGSEFDGIRERLYRLMDRSEQFAMEMDFKPLYKHDRNLYAIGCNLAQGRLDGACYDLLASESSLTSYLTVARGEAPRKHWFMLGRPFIRAAGRTGLISWGGTMFEYLMPRLMMRSLDGTLVAEAIKTAVYRQIEFGSRMGVPWGISESAYNAQYAEGDYQYQSFGVPGLGLKRGLEKDLVVAPYATALATMIVPREAILNLRRIADEGGSGPFGFYEAIDYTPSRIPAGKKSAVVRQYMAHHQGMSLVAITNAVLGEPMVRRFASEPMVRAVDLLLQERIPRDAPTVEPSELTSAESEGTAPDAPAPPMSRRIATPDTPSPRAHLLSNPDYHVMITNSGAGSSAFRGLDVTRWREDTTRDHWGQFIYLRDVNTGSIWSAGFQPVRTRPDSYEVVFADDKATIRRRDGVIETKMEVAVSPEAPVEVRRVTLTNHGLNPREIEVTSYVEVVLLSRGADLAHPAFGKLFVETEALAGNQALLARRRPRSADSAPIWAVHVVASDSSVVGEPSFETDRAKFLGRGRTTSNPSAMDPGAILSGATGAVIDPILSLRRRLVIEPGQSAVISFATAVADTRELAETIADQFRDPSCVARAFDVAWAQAQVEHRQKGLAPSDPSLFQRLGSLILFAAPILRAPGAVLAANRQGVEGLWRYGISGDFPIVLARIGDGSEVQLASHLLTAHSYLRRKGLAFDLVLWNEQPASYMNELREALLAATRESESRDLVDRPGGVFIRQSAHALDEDRALIQAAARIVLIGERGPLLAQLDRMERTPLMPAAVARPSAVSEHPAPDLDWPTDLLFANGLGGFTPDGCEYVVVVRSNGVHPSLPPAPWSNVIANAGFGCLATESGTSATWAANSQANRLTPWTNDPASDPTVEAVYLRDEKSAKVWSPMPRPVPQAATTIVRHGAGYTSYETNVHGLAHELTVFVAPDDPVKLLRLKVRNLDDARRSLSATYYAEWVLGTTREATAAHIATEVDPDTGAILARNPFRAESPARVAFADVDLRPRTITTDRAEFLGRNGDPSMPAALRRVGLSGRSGAALDPCAAIQAHFELGPHEETEVLFLIGEAADIDLARSLVLRYREPGAASKALQDVRARWERLLGTVQVRTPDPAMDLLLNRWLLTQTLSCRVWARSAFYQSGGAYGCRDQLQDVMALCLSAPEEARAQILRVASRQFLEGDIQHWWHTPDGRGVRTRISDDPLWLPFAASHYAEVTGDYAIFDVVVPYLRAAILRPGQEEDYGRPAISDESGTVSEHCDRAIARVQRFGAHNLPLMGTGDWNDGMNRVGSEGHGESVWLGIFLATTLDRWASVADVRGRPDRSAVLKIQATSARSAVETHGWDGEWYRRAYFDNGEPLGSALNDECQIDAIPQAWAAIAGGFDPERVAKAMDSTSRRLVRRDVGIVLLLDPPFDTGPLQPGYIKGYVPGVRENGGQYSHAAAWVALALAKLGRGAEAHEVFQLLNPIRHSDSPEAVSTYKAEPYVLAGDVYGRGDLAGRGGWTWYTGSAGWMYRVGLEAILGFRKLGDELQIDPCIPPSWERYEIDYRHKSSIYRISVENPDHVSQGVYRLEIDGAGVPAKDGVPLFDDGGEHFVRVVMGKATAESAQRVKASGTIQPDNPKPPDSHPPRG